MKLEVGQKISLSRTYEQRDYDRFAALTGDVNPIHVDPEFAAKTRFGKTLAHGMLLFSTLSGAIGRALGEGASVRDVELTFPGPTYTGEAMQIEVEVLEVSGDARSAVVVATMCRPDGTPSCLAKAGVELAGGAS